jgi:hypothetical protein
MPRRIWLQHLCGHDPGWREQRCAAALAAVLRRNKERTLERVRHALRFALPPQRWRR